MAEKIKYIDVELPIVSHTASLIANTIEQLDNRTVRLDMTRRLKGKSLEAIFSLKLKEGKIEVLPKRLHLFGFFIRRVMRKGIDYVEDSFAVDAANAKLTIKPFIIARKKVSRKVRNALRVKMKEEIISMIQGSDYEKIFTDILSSKFQRDLSSKLKKVYPLAFCEIRDIFVMNKKQF